MYELYFYETIILEKRQNILAINFRKLEELSRSDNMNQHRLGHISEFRGLISIVPPKNYDLLLTLNENISSQRKIVRTGGEMDLS